MHDAGGETRVAQPEDAGFTPPDAGDPAVDAGAYVWCAMESASCLANGWEYDAPGRCCLSRMTCFKDAGAEVGFCAY